eukprot:scaffold56445_cov60-Phaeocystis_antarctica.AAC.2
MAVSSRWYIMILDASTGTPFSGIQASSFSSQSSDAAMLGSAPCAISQDASNTASSTAITPCIWPVTTRCRGGTPSLSSAFQSNVGGAARRRAPSLPFSTSAYRLSARPLAGLGRELIGGTAVSPAPRAHTRAAPKQSPTRRALRAW